MLAASACFSVMAVCAGAAHRMQPDLSTFVASTWRAGVNLAVLVLLSARTPRTLLGDGRAALWVRGALGAASLLTFFAALARLGIGEASFLNGTSIIWVAALAPLVLRERTRPAVWVAIVASLVGTALLLQPRGGDLAGRVLGLVSGLVAAGAYLSVRRAAATNGPVAIVFYFTLLATVASLACALLSHATWPTDIRVLAMLAGAGLAATAGQLTMTAAYQAGPAAPIAATGAAGPVFTTLLGASLLGQTPDGRAVVGMAILLFSAVALPFWSYRS
jgi:drug/metabolite transporter (DMT)-like permease